MCGIAGFIGSMAVDQGRVDRCLERMRHRGPDAQGAQMYQAGEITVGLLHSRLSIIDLSEQANQPFCLDDCTIVFNGEIYNHVELREALQSEGVTFHTHCDTEVLLRCYLKYGLKCVDHFEGMWGFAIYDARKRTLLLSRDRFAEKPLYYCRTSDGLVFGSEIKFIQTLLGRPLTVNMRQIRRYLVNGYRSLYKSGETFYENVEELPFAMNLVVDDTLRMEKRCYWQPTLTSSDKTAAQSIEAVRHHLMESVRLRLRADVPIAFCLSGGIDSSALASIAAKTFNYNVATFSLVDSDPRYDESANIRTTIEDLGCDHTIIEVRPAGYEQRLRDLIAYHDAPVYTISYLIHSCLSQAITQAGFRVAVSGTAADELFTGYYDHYLMYLYETRGLSIYAQNLADWQTHVQPVVRNPFLQTASLFVDRPDFRDHLYLNREEFSSFLKDDFDEPFREEAFCDSLLRNRMLNEMFVETIPVILHEDDLNSMRYSIENRSPYLDSRLFEAAYSIPIEHLQHNGYNKYLLREAVKGIVHEKVRTDRQKKGFNAAITSVVDFRKPQGRAYFLDDGPIFDLVKKSAIEDLLDRDHFPNSYSKYLFAFLNARMFLELTG